MVKKIWDFCLKMLFCLIHNSRLLNLSVLKKANNSVKTARGAFFWRNIHEGSDTFTVISWGLRSRDPAYLLLRCTRCPASDALSHLHPSFFPESASLWHLETRIRIFTHLCQHLLSVFIRRRFAFRHRAGRTTAAQTRPRITPFVS